jgi:hypothetical protein
MDAIEAVSVAIYTHEMDEPPTSTEQAMRVFGPTACIAVETLAAQGDITDEDRAEVINVAQRNGRDGGLVLAVLLARQAAVHATHLNSVLDESERRRDAAERYYEAAERNLARAEAAEATVERVRALRDGWADNVRPGRTRTPSVIVTPHPNAGAREALRAALADPKEDA